MIWLLIILVYSLGLVSGMIISFRLIPNVLARLSPQELDLLAEQVQRKRRVAERSRV